MARASASQRFSLLFLILLGAAGLFFGLPNAIAQVPALALLYPACLYLLADLAPSGKKAFYHGWLAGLAANAACLYWLLFPMMDVAGMPWPLAAPTALLLHAYLALYAALTVYAMWGLRRLFSKGRAALFLPPLFGALAFAGLEVACSFILTGFPWLTLGISMAFTPFWAQTASLWGAHGLSALLACAACFTAAACRAPTAYAASLANSGDIFCRGNSRAVALLCAAMAPVVFMAAFGACARQAENKKQGPELTLIMVQGNIDQAVKWDPDFQLATLKHFLDLSTRALKKAGRENPEQSPILTPNQTPAQTPVQTPALIVWPETAMPFAYQTHYEYARVLRNFAESNKLHLAFGAPGLEFHDGAGLYRNRFLLLPPDGGLAQWYDKRHLVPFGEYLPFAGLILPYLPELLQGMVFTPGSSSRPLLMPAPGQNDDLSLGALICYEAIFPALAAENAEAGADILLNVSNDGWFRKSSAPYQHLAHAVLRAVEQRRPLIRATNTGISAVIGANGDLESAIDGLFTTGFLQATIRANRETSLYRAIRPLPETLLLAVAAAALTAAFYASRRKNESS